MTIRLTALAVLAVGFIAVFGCGTAAQAQQATIRPSPQAPVSPNPRSEDELDAYFAVQNAPNAVGRLRLANDFLSDYFDSEFRHLIIRLEWAARGELRHDPEDIIAAALSGIEAQEHFLASKLSFIDNPERVQALPGVRFTLANQKALYYQSIVESYDSQGDFDRVVRYAELALDQQTEALRLHDEMGTVGTEESEQIVTQIQGGRLFVLHTLMRGYQDQGDAQKVVEYGEAIIEITPDDLDTLRTTSMIMSERGPEDPAAVADYFQRAKGHAEVAVREMTRLLDSPEGSQFNDEQKAALLTEVHTTLGMVHFQLEEWADAVDQFRAALTTSFANAGLYYTLALASNANRDLEGTMSALARAAYLGSPEPQVRAALATMYESINGSTDGLEDFIESEGEQIED